MKIKKIVSKIQKYFSKIDKKIWIFLFFLVLITGFVRGYNFNEWLLVRADQERDANKALNFVENGFSHLRMMGPKITRVILPEDSGNGDSLYMGPYYYYVQAFSMKFFGSPDFWTIALPDFILSLLAIPIFFLILSRFFSRQTSILTTVLFSFSFLILQYSRFAWNPNQLIFWQLLLIYSLIKFSFEKKKKAGFWFLVAFLSLLIISQLHFLAIVGTSVVFILFLFYQKAWKKLKLKHYLIALAMFVFFHIPFLVSDIKNDGDNFKRMFFGVSQQSSDSSLKENLRKTLEKSGEFYFYFPASISKDEFSEIEFWAQIYLIVSIFFVFLIHKNKIKLNENSDSKRIKNLTLLVLLYFGVFFLINTKVADRLQKPRYWLSIAPIAFFIVAFWLEWIKNIKNKKGALFLTGAIFTFCLFQNLYSTYFLYSSFKNGVRPELPYRDPIFRPHRELITLGEIRRASDYIAKRGIEEGRNICYFVEDIQTKNAYKYIIKNKYPDLLLKRLDDKSESSKDCLMFYVTKRDHTIKDLKKDLANRFAYRQLFIDGAISLWELKVLEDKDFPAQGDKIFVDQKDKQDKAILWKDLWKEF